MPSFPRIASSSITKNENLHDKMIKTKMAPACPQCGSHKILPIIYGTPGPELKRALRSGQAIMGRREEWEGQPQWHCRECESEWRGSWIRFKRK